jgi:hypothetical protein
LTTFALGGVRLKMETKSKNGTVTQTGWIYSEGEDHLRIDPDVDPDSGELDASMIYRGDLETLFLVNHEEEEYMRLDRETMEKLSVKLNQAMQDMQKQLEQLPEAQRKIMEDMLKQNMPQQGNDFDVEVKEAGVEDGLQKYEVWIGGEERTHVWVAPAESQGLPRGALDSFRNLSQFYQELLSPLASNPMFRSMGANPFPGFANMQGVPVRILHLEEGRETRLSEAKVESLSSDLFSPPESYQERRPELE